MYRMVEIVRRLLAAILVPALFGCGAAWAVGKITEDPNAPGARVEQDAEEAPKTDSRLAQEITLEMRGKSVAAVLGELSRLSGVTLYAGYNNSDWQVRDRKMNVFAKDVPLAHLMSSIARVMKFKWSIRGEPDAYTYRLYMDRSTLLSAEAQRARDEERLEQQRAERRMKALEGYARLGDMSQEELAALRQDNPFLYMIAESGLRKSLGSFFAGAPAAMDAIANNRELSLSASQLSPAAQQGLVNAMGDLNGLMTRVSGREMPMPSGLTEKLDQVTIRINPEIETRTPGPESAVMLGSMRIEFPSGEDGRPRHGDVPIIDPDSNFAKLIGEMMLDSTESGRSMEDVVRERGRDIEQAFMQAFLADFKREEKGEPLIEHADEPELERKVELKSTSRRLDEVQQALAEASGFAVVSDSFGAARGIVRLPEAETEIRTILDKIAEGYMYNWDRRGPIIEFRDREWYRKRTLQIPDAWMEAWRDTLKRTGTLDIADLAQIAALTPEQMDFNFLPDDPLSRSGVRGTVTLARDFLSIYGLMTPTQQAAVFSESGLDLAALSPEQWATAFKHISRRSPAFFGPDGQHRVVVTGSRKPDGKSFQYEFTATTSYGLEPVKWRFTTPLYVEEPPKPSGQ